MADVKEETIETFWVYEMEKIYFNVNVYVLMTPNQYTEL